MFKVEAYSTFEESDSLVITAPSDFKFYLVGREQTLNFMELILTGGEQLLPDGTRVRIEDNGVHLIDTDVWLNPKYDQNTLIATRTGLAYMALMGLRTYLL